MTNAIAKLTSAIQKREAHSFLLCGNVYDYLQVGDKRFEDAIELLAELTARKFPQCLTYDLFSGLKVLRGDAAAVAKAMGFGQNFKPNDPNAELVEALKRAKLPGGAQTNFPVNPLELFPGIDALLGKADNPTVVILDRAEAVCPAGVGNLNRQSERVCALAIAKWSRSSVVRKNGHLIALISRHPSDLDESVLDRTFEIAQIRFSKPDGDERARLAQELDVPAKEKAAFVSATSGLRVRELTRLLTDSQSRSSDELLASVFREKQKILRDEYGDLLELMEPKNGFEAIGGLEGPVAKLKTVARAMRQGKNALVPQGILFMGPPGTGKTVLAEAFAKEAGLNFVKPLDIKSMWVGESERRMTKFMAALRDLAPVVVFVDEFDQNQGQRGGFDGDSGVSRSLFKKMLEVMSDTSLRGKVLWILATNRPDLIDPAMKRPGRCDLRIPFLPPDTKQLALICRAALRQFPEIRSDIADWQPYARRCQGYTGADMIEVIRRAWEHANEGGREAIVAEDMDWACGDFRPQLIDRASVARMALLSILECSSAALLPANHETLSARYAEELTGVRPSSGKLASEALTASVGKAELN